MKYIQINNYIVKCRAYFNKEQVDKIEKILYALRLVHNNTFYEMHNGNPMVTKLDKKGNRWPDFTKAEKAEWLNYLRENDSIIKEAPSEALSTNLGMIKSDMVKSYENFHPPIVGKQKKNKDGSLKFNKKGEPVWEKSKEPKKLPCNKWDPKYYCNANNRQSFHAIVKAKIPFEFKDNSKSIYINIPKLGKVKLRGFRFDLLFGDGPEYTFEEYCKNHESKRYNITILKDKCNDYYVMIHFKSCWKPCKEKSEHKEIGVDVGVKDIAITSEGEKYENKRFMAQGKKRKIRMNRQLSRRMGWANIKFRKAHEENKELKPSKRYENSRLKLAKLERKIARRRENYNNNVSIDIVSGASFIGIESLAVKDMMKDKHRASGLADAAMYDVLHKISYKANWHKVPVVEIGQFDPSTQLCHVCGYKNPELKDTRIREWTCPQCGSHHDRDINAAKNILNIAKAKALE